MSKLCNIKVNEYFLALNRACLSLKSYPFVFCLLTSQTNSFLKHLKQFLYNFESSLVLRSVLLSGLGQKFPTVLYDKEQPREAG